MEQYIVGLFLRLIHQSRIKLEGETTEKLERIYLQNQDKIFEVFGKENYRQILRKVQTRIIEY